MLDNAIDTLVTDPKALIGGAVLALVSLIFVGRKVRNAKAGKIADKLVGPVMFAGMIWSADAVWVLTGPDHLALPTPLRIAMFAVLEFALLVAMLRAKDSMDRIGHTGRYGATAWLTAIAGFGFILGFYEGGLVVAAFRPLIPLMLTKLWWDGVLGDSPRKTGSFKWTPRNLLIRLGAIDADDRDVKTVNRDRLIQRMTDLYYDSLYGPEGKRETRRTRLARLTLDADDKVIREVMHRVRRTQWTTAEPLPYDLTQPDDAAVTHGATQADAGVAVPPVRRVKHATQTLTSGDPAGADPATQAASLVLTQGLSTREAARKVGGVSPSTVLRRVEKLRDAQPDAPGDAALTHNPINGHPVLAESAN